MCGIAGIVGPMCKKSILEQMGKLMRHRGPDDFRLWLGAEESIGFVHTRLAIIDPKGGKQPMLTAGKRFVLCYNGEIYNYLDLMNELYSRVKSMSEHWETASDVEVLLYVFQQFGVNGIKKLNGMFAFIIWDEKENKLYAVRDRFGIKPLYYYFDGENIIIASEIKAILQAGIKAEIDITGFSQYIELQYCLEDRTMFKNIKRILPGHYLIYDYYSRKLSFEKYWDIPVSEVDSNYDEEKYIEKISYLLHDSVHLQLRSDFPVGCHLSGGLDSSTICSIAADLVDHPLKTFTGGFNYEGYNEEHYAKLLAKQIGAEHFSIFPNSYDLRDNFKKLIYILDEPIAGAAIFPQYFLSKLISENGVKVALGGQGGDEIFCGYVRYLIAVFEDCLKSEVYRNGSIGSSSGLQLTDIMSNLNLLKGYEPLMGNYFSEDIFGDISHRYYNMMRRTSGLETVLSKDIYQQNGSVRDVLVGEFEKCASKNIIDRMTVFDIKNHLQSLLHLEDRASMAWSVESRVPLLDHRIVEATMAIPAQSRFANGHLKHIFKKIIHNIIPEEIFNRTDKKGFPVPISEWFRSDLSGWIREILLSKVAKERGIYDIKAMELRLKKNGAFDRTIWGLLSIEYWHQNFFDK